MQEASSLCLFIMQVNQIPQGRSSLGKRQGALHFDLFDVKPAPLWTERQKALS